MKRKNIIQIRLIKRLKLIKQLILTNKKQHLCMDGYIGHDKCMKKDNVI